MLAHFICRYGMLSPDKSSTPLKAMRLQCTLFALTTRRTFRYFLDDFTSAILKLCSAIFVLALYLLFWLLSMLLGSLSLILVSQSCTSNYFIFIICLWVSTTLASLQFIFSTAIDGKIKAWLYDCLGSRVDYDAPGHWCTTMSYSADGTR